MEVIRYPQLRAADQSSSVTIGNFDGLHLGHRALITQVVEHAQKMGNRSVVVTMQPLPLQYFQHKGAVELLTPFRCKYHLLKEMGVDVMCVLNFNQRLAQTSAQDFFNNILIQGLGSHYILVGDDFKFGAGRKGDFAALEQMALATKTQVEQLPSIKLGSHRVSSTIVRDALQAGDFVLARDLLGRHFNVLGKVAHGQKLGRELGYPTVNIELKQGGFPLHGIYVVTIIVAGKCHQAVASVGVNPTVGGNTKRIEVYVLDFDQQIYGQCVEVLFYKKLRNEVEFDSLTALISAIEKDVQQTQEFFANFKGELV